MPTTSTPPFNSLPAARTRAAAIIIRDGNILLMHRQRDGEEYFVFPGGGIEPGESPEEAMRREVQEELTLTVDNMTLAFQLNNQGHKEWYFLVKNISGDPKLGGPEKEHMTDKNQYDPRWVSVDEALTLPNLLPHEAQAELRHLVPTL